MYQMIDKDKVYRLVADNGPVIPIQMKKDLGGDTIIIGAILSQLVSEQKVRVTSVKIGGSPAYYTPGTEERLVSLIKYLNEKDRRVAQMLEQTKVLRESTQSPLVRVSLRSISDFSKPLEVSVKGQTEIYWKWFLLDNSEAEKLIAQDLKIEPKQETESPQQMPPTPEPATPEMTPVPKDSHKPKKRVATDKEAFARQVRSFCEKNNIEVLDLRIVKKSELELIVKVPTHIGFQEYYCKARDKKRISDGDLSSAYVEGQGSKLPILLLITGELSKKALEMQSNLKGIVVKKI